MKIIHTADLHLGRSFETNDIEFNKIRRLDLFSTFENLLKYARDNKIYHILISGDFYELDKITFKEIKLIVEIINRYSSINIYIIAGNHDPKDKNSWYERIEWPKTVMIFGFDTEEYAEIENVRLYGLSWEATTWIHDKKIEFDLDKNYVNILMLHGDTIGNESEYFDIDRKYYLEQGFNYLALGHIHKPELNTNYAYPGSLEPMKFANNTNHGFVILDVDNHVLINTFCPFSQSNYKTIDYNINSKEDIKFGICSKMNEIGNKQDVFRVNINGYINDTTLKEIDEYLNKIFKKVWINAKEIVKFNPDLLKESTVIKKFEEQLEFEKIDKDMKELVFDIGVTALIKMGRF